MHTPHRRAGVVALAAALATLVAMPAGASAAVASEPGADGPVDAGIFVEKVEGLSPDFANGVDVSTVLSLEESGVVFRDDTGAPADLFDVLAEDGVNTVRVRVWNDPFDASGNGYGGGNVDVARAVEIGERATAAGLSVLVDFHYSDFWADPARQLVPKAWAGLSDAETVTALHDFTADAPAVLRGRGRRRRDGAGRQRDEQRDRGHTRPAARSTRSSRPWSPRAARRCARCCPTRSWPCTSRTPSRRAGTRRMPRASRVRRGLRRVRELVLPVLARHDRRT